MVADRADIAKSTASDVLHRAEGAVMSWFLDQHDGPGVEPGSP